MNPSKITIFRAEKQVALPRAAKFQTYRCQCWTEGGSSMAVAEDLRPTATVAEI